MSRIQLSHTYQDIISAENVVAAWKEFASGKKSKLDVQQFSLRLMDNILQVIDELASKRYRHGPYQAFNISDPKPRNIHKASVKDRLVHHALYRKLYPFFDKTFIADSYSCRIDKGTFKAIGKFQLFFRKVSNNNTRTCWVLKCDIRKFFASIDHAVLFEILRKYIPDKDVLSLLENIVTSFHTTAPGTGLPLGNLTSQLLVNIYMNEFDQWIKHTLKAKYYIRYADDFVFLSEDKGYLESIVPKIEDFLEKKLKLSLHPDKVSIGTFAAGVDFLGWVHFPQYRVLRTTTKKRIMKNLAAGPKQETITSYLGLLTHGNALKIKEQVLKIVPNESKFSM